MQSGPQVAGNINVKGSDLRFLALTTVHENAQKVNSGIVKTVVAETPSLNQLPSLALMRKAGNAKGKGKTAMKGSGSGKADLRVEKVREGIASHVATMSYTPGPSIVANSDRSKL